jgi:hypothetical protein
VEGLALAQRRGGMLAAIGFRRLRHVEASPSCCGSAAAWTAHTATPPVRAGRRRVGRVSAVRLIRPRGARVSADWPAEQGRAPRKPSTFAAGTTAVRPVGTAIGAIGAATERGRP